MKNGFSNWLLSRARAFARAERGAVAPLVGIGAIMLVGATGVAIDTARLQLVQTRLSNSLDAAGLAAGATVSTTNATTEAKKYLNSNFNGYMGANLIGDPVVTPNSDNTIINLSASANVPTMFMKIFGITSNTVSATSEITRASKGLELVMVLDNTGSMAGSKLTSLKTAASDLVNILHGNSTPDNLWIGLVPFSQAVNVGSTHADWLDTTTFNWGPTSWGGCMDARTGTYDRTDDPPSVRKFTAYFWPDSNDDDIDNDWRHGSSGNYTYETLSNTLGPNKSCPQEVTRMTASKNTITNAVNGMVAAGNTHISEGAIWGWRMISPRWRGLWGGSMAASSLPLDYNTQNMNKAVIIMTDGDNTIDNDNRGAYGYLSDCKLYNDAGTSCTTSQSTAETRLDSRLTADCTAMKNNNIYVYTVSFGTVSNASKTMLRNCATQSDFYFDSPNSTTLQAAFRAIGDSLSNLRVSR